MSGVQFVPKFMSKTKVTPLLGRIGRLRLIDIG